MITTSRREFLRAAGLVTGGMFVPTIFRDAVEAARAERPLSSTAAADASLNRTLIVIQLAGGNDGVNALIPYQNSRYYELRPNLAIPGGEVVPLNADVGLHPALQPLSALWERGDMAVIGNVGYDEPSLSHFQAMDVWHKADPAQARKDGWLSSLVSGAVDADGHPLGALSLGNSITPTLCCPPTPPPAFNGIESYQLLPDSRFPGAHDARIEALQQLYSVYQAPAPYAALLDGNADAALESSALLQSIVLNHEPVTPYPASPFGQGLELLAAAIVHDVGLRIGYIVLGGFDTHAGQLNTHAALLGQLSQGVAALFADLEAAGKQDDVVVMTWSEFGRRPQENGSAGSDHGTAAPQLVFGSSVAGGYYGDLPDLDHLDENGNLRYSVDFRSVYATVLERWIETDPAPILGGSFPILPIFE
jgi:uncharacterized protein (DUF1501 family)